MRYIFPIRAVDDEYDRYSFQERYTWQQQMQRIGHNDNIIMSTALLKGMLPVKADNCEFIYGIENSIIK